MPPRERREPGVDVPKPENSVVDVAMRLWNTPRPATESLEYGEVVPMPTLRLLFAMVKATLLEKSVEDAMLKDLSVELYPIFQASASEPNRRLASPLPVVPPTVTSPAWSTLKSVVVAVPAVVEAMANSGVPAAVLAELEIERSAYGEVVPIPTYPAVERKSEEVAVSVVPSAA